jgi:L-ascorbate metabolism protein UlaG (beta-lactamase superfamily)
MRRAVLLLVLLTSCAGSRVGNFDYRNPGCPVPNHSNAALTVRYLGSGGVYINWKDHGLLLGPYFSHSGGPGAALVGHVHFDRTRIATGMNGVANVRAILFGHSHFDHIADLPVIAQEYAKDALIYTNDSGLKLLGHYADLQARAKSVEHDDIRLPDVPIRIRAVKWDHAPQLCRWRHLPCTYAFGEATTQTQEWEKVRLREMRGGQTYAYVIELMEGNDVAFRIFYNDSAGDDRIAELPPAGAYDLAILCMPSYDFVNGYPQTLLERLQPRHVLISHYEDFFKKQKTRSWSFVQLLCDEKAARFIKLVESKVTAPRRPTNDDFCGARDERWSMPVPGDTLAFR